MFLILQHTVMEIMDFHQVNISKANEDNVKIYMLNLLEVLSSGYVK